MARIRTIKPEFPQSESMGRVSREARLCFVMLWTIADDSGRLRANSRMLSSLLFPYDDDAPGLIDGWLAELEAEGCLVRYQADGNNYLEVCNWLIHQKIDRPSPSKIPPPCESSRILANAREPSSLDQGSRIKDQGKGPKDQDQPAQAREAPKAPKAAGLDVAALVADGLTESTATELLALRKRKRAPLTPRAWDGIKAEFAKAGMATEQGAVLMLARGWQGFSADWVAGRQPAPQGRGFDPVAYVNKDRQGASNGHTIDATAQRVA